MNDLLERARRAYQLCAERSGWVYEQPGSGTSTVDSHKGTTYAVLRNTRGVIAVYRVTKSGRLAWCVSYPSALKNC